MLSTTSTRRTSLSRSTPISWTAGRDICATRATSRRAGACAMVRRRRSTGCMQSNVRRAALALSPITAFPCVRRRSRRSLVTLGGNPVFDAPADFNFAEAFKKVAFRAHVGHYYDETGILAHWHIPQTHYLESWSDVRAYDGTVSIIQPLISPLYNGRSPHE